MNETRGHASISYESTRAVFRLTELLKKAVVIKTVSAKKNDKNQKTFDRMVFLQFENIQLLVGHQKSKDEYVQYCITVKK